MKYIVQASGYTSHYDDAQKAMEQAKEQARSGKTVRIYQQIRVVEPGEPTVKVV